MRPRRRDPFIKRFFEGLHPSNFPGGVELHGQYGIKRLNDLRNGFKHTAGFPGPNAIADVKADTAHFFLENTRRVFGFAFDDVDLAEVVQHDQTRAHLKTAAQLNSEGSLLEAMGTLAIAFEELMNDQTRDEHAPRGRSAYSIGEPMPSTASERSSRRCMTSSPPATTAGPTTSSRACAR
ncbi:hypothetical protein [Streptomyces mirabilis]|uniref:hypothetical protein n=1 Tax=Streptomyces mirabilis TaxID=68239 RepID=UPI002F914B58